MTTRRIAVIVGSLRKESFNRKLADALAERAPETLSLHSVEIGDLPLYNQDDDASPHPNVVRFKREIEQADGVLFTTPEYNRSISGVLKNALDHASRPYGESVWAGKPAGVAGVSVGAIGTAAAQQHLRTILAYLDMPTLGQPEMFLKADAVFDDAGALREDSTAFIDTWLKRYAGWVAQHVDA